MHHFMERLFLFIPTPTNDVPLDWTDTYITVKVMGQCMSHTEQRVGLTSLHVRFLGKDMDQLHNQLFKLFNSSLFTVCQLLALAVPVHVNGCIFFLMYTIRRCSSHKETPELKSYNKMITKRMPWPWNVEPWSLLYWHLSFTKIITKVSFCSFCLNEKDERWCIKSPFNCKPSSVLGKISETRAKRRSCNVLSEPVESTVDYWKNWSLWLRRLTLHHLKACRVQRWRMTKIHTENLLRPYYWFFGFGNHSVVETCAVIKETYLCGFLFFNFFNKIFFF